MPHVRQLLESNDGWLDVLVNVYKIQAVRCQQDNHLISLKYSQIDSPMEEPIVQECRGMVVDARSRQILAFGLRKFWNHSESLAAKINWQSGCHILDKVDGSLMQLFWDPAISQWRVSSSGHPTAGGTVWPGTQTFRDLFWQTFASLGMKLPPESFAGHTFCLELATDSNRIVCKTPKPRLVLLAARDIGSEKEWSRNELASCAFGLNWELVKAYPLNNLDDVMKAAEVLNPVENEGFVVVDDKFNRVKIKSPRYVALHHLKSNISTDKNMTTLLMSGDSEEFLVHFPEFQADFNRVKTLLDASLAELTAVYQEFRHLASQKDFALAIKDKSKMTGILFQARKQNVEVADVWKKSADLVIKSLF